MKLYRNDTYGFPFCLTATGNINKGLREMMSEPFTQYEDRHIRYTIQSVVYSTIETTILTEEN